MNDKQRSEFERWFTSQIDSEYCSPNVKALMSECWQAAIASVVVEFPKIYFDPYADERTQSIESGKETALDEVKWALDKAGIRYE